jgi:hypothetical protein
MMKDSYRGLLGYESILQSGRWVPTFQKNTAHQLLAYRYYLTYEQDAFWTPGQRKLSNRNVLKKRSGETVK